MQRKLNIRIRKSVEETSDVLHYYCFSNIAVSKLYWQISTAFKQI